RSTASACRRAKRRSFSNAPRVSNGTWSRRRFRPPIDEADRPNGAARVGRLKTAPDPAKPAAPLANMGEAGALDAIFAALSDPIRRDIIVRLTRGSCSVTQLGAPFEVSAPAISKHLAVLERCGLIARWKIGRVHY